MHFNLSTLALAATTFLASATALSPQDIPTDESLSSLLTSAQSHLTRGESSEALIYYDAAIARDPTNYLTFFKRATTYLSLGKTTQATDDFNKVLSIRPGFEGAHIQLARLRARMGDWDGAKNQYLAANLGHDTGEVKGLDDAKLAAALASMAAEGEKWDECVSHASTAIAVASRSSTLRELRSRCRFARGEVEEGMNDLRHVLQMKPGDTTPHVVISASSFYALGDLDGGLGQIRKCLHSDPDSKVCKKLHKQEKAVHKIFKRAQGQLSRGQSTTAGRTLTGTADEEGLLPEVRKQVDELRENGSIPKTAPSKLVEELVDLTCQAYIEVKYCISTVQIRSHGFSVTNHLSHI